MELTTGLVIGYVTLWVVLVNGAVLLPRSSLLKAIAWGVACLVLLGLGWMVDLQTYTKPHNAYVMWEFFATFTIASAVMALPAGLWVWFKH